MGAWFVSKAHIDLLVTYATDNAISKLEPTALGRLLWQENAKSLRHSYSDADSFWPLKDAETYKFEPAGAPGPAHLIVASGCYAYQSCEHPGWVGSEAAAVADAIENHAARAARVDLGAFWKQNTRNRNIPWGHEEEDVIRLEAAA